MDLSRRDFTKLSMAAVGGMLAGCSRPDPAPPAAPEAPAPVAEAGTPKEIHACRGLNSCKGLGAGGNNACAGQGSCATAKAHACGGANECKGQGGCGENPGYNECKAQGGCAVPMTHAGAWEKARQTFEERMKAAGKEFGEPPARQES